MSRFADIAVNLTDPQWSGSYHGKKKHPVDIGNVLSRAKSAGVERILITGTSLEESRVALELAQRYGLHCGPDLYIDELRTLIQNDRGEGGSKRVVSVGEIGLDYDRLHFTPKETQRKHLPKLLSLAKEFQLPLFLHSRNPEAHRDLVEVLTDVRWPRSGMGDGWAGGVVHSFTGTIQEANELIDLGLYIGVNCCSLKTEANLEVVKSIPLDRLLLETDSPWCSITSTHASNALFPEGLPQIVQKVKDQKWTAETGVKGRMEPAEVVVVAHVVAKLHRISVDALAQKVWDNTMRLFPDMR